MGQIEQLDVRGFCSCRRPRCKTTKISTPGTCGKTAACRIEGAGGTSAPDRFNEVGWSPACLPQSAARPRGRSSAGAGVVAARWELKVKVRLTDPISCDRTEAFAQPF